MITKILQRAFLLVFLVVPLGASADDDEFSAVYVFGDSLSDNGNLAILPIVDPAQFGFLAFLNAFPFDAGFSNGDRAVEVLADGLGLQAEPSLYLVTLPDPLAGTNFAVAGARSTVLLDDLPIDLPIQIGAFLQSQSSTAPLDALYVVFIGGNDVRDARDAGSKEAANQIILDAVAGIDGAIRTLAQFGAENFLVANVPDIGAIPETRLIASAIRDPDLPKRATKLTRMFNRRLAKAIDEIEEEFDIEILEFDTFRFLRSTSKKGDQLGFINTQDPCFFTSAGTFNPACEFGANFDVFVFFDEIHPTAAVHELAGQAMLRLLWDDDDDDDDDDD